MALYVVDCGHGGHESKGKSSARGLLGPGGTPEKDVTLELGRRIVAVLGRDAILTRDGDYNLSLGQRLAIASEHGPAAFVSVHAGGAGPRGPQTWLHRQAGAKSNLLARSIHGALVRLGGGDRGLHRGDLAVLTPGRLPAHTAACLVEVDALGHPHGERTLRDPRENDRLARAIADALRTYGGAPQPRLVPRCYQRQLTVPETYDELEAQVRDWIATCVTSRTDNLHLERELVNGNPSLMDVWNMLSGQVGSPAQINADYVFDENGREQSITFSLPTTTYDFSDQGEDVVVSRYMPTDEILDKTVQAAQVRLDRGESAFDGLSLKRIICLAQIARQEGADDRVILGNRLLSMLGDFTEGRIGVDALWLSFRSMFRFILRTASEADLLRRMSENADQIIQAIDFLNRRKAAEGGNFSPRQLALSQLLDRRRRTPGDLYSCFQPLS